MADGPAEDLPPAAPAPVPAVSGFERLRRLMQQPAPARPDGASPAAVAGTSGAGSAGVAGTTGSVGSTGVAGTAGAASQVPERCDFCDVPIPEEHPHVVDMEKRSLLCACRPCYLVFAPEGAAGGRYRAVPQVCKAAPGLALTDALWDELQIPIDIAFFFINSAAGQTVAFYPSPGGATESLLPLASWDRLVEASPELLGGLSPDVEALLVYRHAPGRHQGGEPAALLSPPPAAAPSAPPGEPAPVTFECYIVSIDACYELVGRIRRSWKGFHGGTEAWQAIGEFFAALRQRSGAAR